MEKIHLKHRESVTEYLKFNSAKIFLNYYNNIKILINNRWKIYKNRLKNSLTIIILIFDTLYIL